ncbi:MAG: TerB family tellurite resistance protein [Pseudomonadota bacterium]
MFPPSSDIGAAGVLVRAASENGSYTEIEEGRVTRALMKLFHMNNAAAATLRREAEDLLEQSTSLVSMATAAKELDSDKKEALMSHAWSLVEAQNEDVVGQSIFMRGIADIFGFTPERTRALRFPPSPEMDD